MSLLEGLNQPQQEAVTQTEGPVLVLAGAGSGKTKMLVHRIAYLIREKSVQPENILSVTFTNKAAGEMRERIGKLLGVQPHRGFMPFMGTFHSICVRILRQDGESIGISRNFVIFDTSDQRGAIKRAMKDLKIDTKQYEPRRIASLISNAKNEMLSPGEYEGIASSPPQKVAADVYKKYQSILREAKALDFDDLLMQTAVMLRTQPEVLAKWRQQFKYILIDEYQDTNAVQYNFAKLLAAEHHNICVVGDDWQSIYSWRGADFRNILNFNKDYPEVKTIKLEQNYRSTKAILDAANQVITKNTNRSDKKIWTAEKAGEPVKIIQAVNEHDEGEQIINVIKRQTSVGANSYQDFALLYRTNAQSRSLEDMMLRYNIPYRIVGGTRFYDRKEIKDIVAYLRLIYQPNDRISFERVVNVPTRGIGATSLQRFYEWIDQGSRSLQSSLLAAPGNVWEGLARVNECPDITKKAASSLSNFYELISRLQDFNNEGAQLPELVDAVIRRTDFLNYLDDGSMQAEERQENVRELISVAKENQDLGLAGFLEEVALISDIDSYDNRSDSVTLMTLHAAKGLEFPIVFMAGMEEGIFPHSSTFYDAEELEEERRLCYVGMTRAKSELFLVYATSRLLWGTTQHNPPSRFLADVDANMQSVSVNTEVQGIDSIPSDDEVVNVNVGERVRHPIFGVGVIKSIDGTNAEIAFDRRGKKTLNLAFAPIEKA